MWGYSDHIFKNGNCNTGTYLYGYISRFIWVTPAVLLINRHGSKLRYNRKELFSPPRYDSSLVVVISASLAYVVLGMLLTHGGLWFNSGVSLGLVLIKYFIVGFVEETVFRGWGYNSLASILSHKKAAAISTLFFVLLHWPSFFIKFFRSGAFDFTGIAGQSISALIWGFVFCWLLKKGRSIWSPVAAHTVFDLTYVLLIGGS